jgi:hypothetical protein
MQVSEKPIDGDVSQAMAEKRTLRASAANQMKINI